MFSDISWNYPNGKLGIKTSFSVYICKNSNVNIFHARLKNYVNATVSSLVKFKTFSY